MELIGRVMWWSIREQHGIIIDPQGNEFYFDISVLDLKPRQQIKPDSVVVFQYSPQISDCLCAHKVKLPVASKKKTYERRFETESVAI